MTLPQGWVEATLDSLTHRDSPICYGVLKPGETNPGGVRMVRVTDIRANQLDVSGIVTITDELDQEFHRSRIEEGDVLISVQGTVGRVAVVPSDLTRANISRTIARIRTCEGVSPYWLWRALRSPQFQEASRDKTAGTTRDSLNIGTLRELSIPVPPISEQHRIFAKLDTLTAGICRSREKLDRVRKLAQWLRGFALARLWASTERQTLAGLLTEPIRNGLSIAGSEQPPGQPALKLSALRGAIVNLSDVRYIPIDSGRADKYRIEAGDILVSRGNGTLSLVGKASRVGEAAGEYPIFPDTAFRLRPNPKFVCSEWLLYVWNSSDVRRQIESVARTTAGIWKISQRDLAQIQIPVASLEDQRRMAGAIGTAFARADRLEAEATRARALLDRLEAAVFAKAFRGELVPQDPKDEPASVLLDRIRAERAAAPKAKRGRARKAVG